MKPNKHILLIVLLAILAPNLLLAQAWAGKGRAEGLVVDRQGQPIEGAQVTLRPASSPDDGPEPLTTNKKGRWGYLGLTGGIWAVTIDADGYMTSRGQMQVNEFD